MLSKCCQILQHFFIKQFALMESILIVLLKLIMAKFDIWSGGPGPKK